MPNLLLLDPKTKTYKEFKDKKALAAELKSKLGLGEVPLVASYRLLDYHIKYDVELRMRKGGRKKSAD